MVPEVRAVTQALRNIPMDLISTPELSAYLRCNRKTIERMVARGVLQPFRVGRAWRFSRTEVIERLRTT